MLGCGVTAVPVSPLCKCVQRTLQLGLGGLGTVREGGQRHGRAGHAKPSLERCGAPLEMLGKIEHQRVWQAEEQVHLLIELCCEETKYWVKEKNATRRLLLQKIDVDWNIEQPSHTVKILSWGLYRAATLKERIVLCLCNPICLQG
jgi:hypothetical protein